MTLTTTSPALPDQSSVTDPIGWTPAGSVHCAIIVVEAPDATPQQVVNTRWASEAEARGYIERRLKAVTEIRAPAKVSGYVVPATTRTGMRNGELVQDVTLVWAQAQRGVLNARGFVTW